MVVLTTLLGASHGYFETYRIIAPAEAVSAKLIETISAEFPTELAEPERPAIIQYSVSLHLRMTETQCPYLSTRVGV